MQSPAVFVLLLACCVSADPLFEVLKELAKLIADVTALQSLTQDQAAEIEKLKEQLKGKQVAFSASLVDTSHQTFGPFKGDTTLAFKYVVTNVGNAYSPVTGAFTAPLKGAYHFEWHIFGPEGRTGAVLVKNSENIFTAYEHQPSLAASAFQGVILQLEAGDAVFVRLWGGTTVFDNMNHHTTFSGHLLFTL